MANVTGAKPTQRHLTAPEILIRWALKMMPASSRSGAYSGIGSFTPVSLNKGYFTSRQSSKLGRIKHTAEVRSIKKHQRYRAYQKSLRR